MFLISIPKIHESWFLGDLQKGNQKKKKLTLTKEDVAHGVVDVILGGLTGVGHESVNELHALRTGSTELSRDDDLATLGTGFHDEAKNTIAGPEKRKKKADFSIIVRSVIVAICSGL